MENNSNQNQPYPQSGQPYPQSGQPYPQSGQLYPQSGQPYPQSGQPYPQSGQPYPMSQQYPPSGQPYPMSGQPYPMSGYADNSEKKHTMTIIIVIIAIVLVAALVTVGIMLSRRNTGFGPMGPGGQGGPPPMPPMGMDMMDYSAYSQYETEVRRLEVDGQEITLPQYMLNINDLSFISVQDFASVFGYETIFDMRNKQTKVSGAGKEITFSNGIASAIVTNEDGSGREVSMLDKPMMFSNNQTYVPLKSMKDVFGFKSVEWDEDNNTVVIKTDGVTVPVNTTVEKTDANVATDDPNMQPPGGPGGPPPGEGGYPGGQPQGGPGAPMQGGPQ